MTIFFGPEKWDGPLSLFDMMDISDSAVLACMDNYHVRLIAPAQMTDDEIMKFQSSFREVERRAADVIEVITNSGIKYDEEEEMVDVCQAIQEMRQKSEQRKAR